MPTRPARRRGARGGSADVLDMLQAFKEAQDHARVIGIDPDTRHLGVCGWSRGEPGPKWVATTHLSKDVKGAHVHMFREALRLFEEVPRFPRPLILLEVMRYRVGENVTPQSLIDLNFVGGTVAAAALTAYPDARVIPVEPSQWKGSVKKQIHHTRLMTQLAWRHEVLKSYVRPIDPPVIRVGKIKPADWKHVLDGVGLARWGLEQLKIASRVRGR